MHSTTRNPESVRLALRNLGLPEDTPIHHVDPLPGATLHPTDGYVPRHPLPVACGSGRGFRVNRQRLEAGAFYLLGGTFLGLIAVAWIARQIAEAL